MAVFLNIAEWDPVTPVILPLGPLNAIPFIYASYGIFLPFILFIVAVFIHFFSEWQTPRLPK
jgi:hypothetical protein